MATIIPRWEWRTFGSRFARAEKVFASLEPKDVQESSEVYLLTETGSNVKIRNELLDIKVLQEVNAAGLEQWLPVMKEGFPLSAATVGEVFKAMDVPTPPFDRSQYTLEQFLTEIVEPNSAVRTVKVHKRRVRYTVGGCMAELSEVTVGGKKTQTIAVESENAEAIVSAVRSLGLADYVNTNYTRGLSDLVSGILPRYAIIDVGTNSVKFHIGEFAEDKTWRAVVDRAELTRLGEGLEKSGVIAAEATERTETAIAGMADEASAIGAWQSRPSVLRACGMPEMLLRSSKEFGPKQVSASRSSPGRRRAGWLTWRFEPGSRWAGTPWWCSIRVGVVRSSPSGRENASLSASAWTSARFAIPNVLGSAASSPPKYSLRRLPPFPRTSPESMDVRGRTPSQRWAVL